MTPQTPASRSLALLWSASLRAESLQEFLEGAVRAIGRIAPLERLEIRRIDHESCAMATIARAPGHVVGDTDVVSLRPGAIHSIIRRLRAEPSLLPQEQRRTVVMDAIDPHPRPSAGPVAGTGSGNGPGGGLGAGSGTGPRLALPLHRGAHTTGVALLHLPRGATWRREWRSAIEPLAEPIAAALQHHLDRLELRRLRAAAEAERDALLRRLGRDDGPPGIVGTDSGLRHVMERVELVARTDLPTLILGETGSGKEVVARAIHDRSSRSGGPFVRVNCGAIPPELVDSELFGHEMGAFTGATRTRRGWFERADGGTLFLDEVGELPASVQVRLLRVLQEGTLERVGGEEAVHVSVRVLSATHCDLASMVQHRQFREDLWYRLAVFQILLPPLRDRLHDIAELARHFAIRAARRFGLPAVDLSDSDIAMLRRYDWPGNVRELASVMDRAVILGRGTSIEVGAALGHPALPTAGTSPDSPLGDQTSRGANLDRANPGRSDLSWLPPGTSPASPLRGRPATGVQPISELPVASTVRSLDDATRAHIARVLTEVHGRIEGPHGAAVRLAVNPHTLRARMRRLGIDWAVFRPSALRTGTIPRPPGDEG